MGALIDVVCRKCKKRYGFGGKMTDQPPCPRCGFKPSEEELKQGEEEMQAMRKELEAEINARQRPIHKEEAD